MLKQFITFWLLLAGAAPIALAQSPLDSLRQIWQDNQQADSTRLEALDQMIDFGSIFQNQENADSLQARAASMKSFAKARGLYKWEATAFLRQARIASMQRQPDMAMEHTLAALKIAEEAEDVNLQGDVNYRIGRVYVEQFKQEQAFSYFMKSVAQFSETKDSSALVFSLVNAGFIHPRHAESDTILVMFRSGLRIATAIKYPRLQIWVLRNIGEFFWVNQSQGSIDSALRYYRQGLEVSRTWDNNIQTQTEFLYKMGLLYINSNNLPEGLKVLKEALVLSEQFESRQRKGEILMQIGRAYQKNMDFNQVQTYLDSASAIFDKWDYAYGQSDVLMLYGQFYQISEPDSVVKPYFEKALALGEQIKHPRIISFALGELGPLVEREGQIEKALAYFERGLELEQQAGTKQGKAQTLERLGSFHYRQEQYQKAIPYLEDALTLSQEIGLVTTAHKATQHLFYSYSKIGNASQALEYYFLSAQFSDSLTSEENQRATIRLEFENKALSDSLAFVQQQAETKLAYQGSLAQRNYLLIGGTVLALLIFGFVRYRQQNRNRQKEMELDRERSRKQQLEEMSQLKSRFFANISHELRTPLTLILGPLSQLLKGPKKASGPELNKQLTVMQRNGESLQHLIEEILDLSKLEAKKMELEEAQTSLIPFIKGIIADFEPRFAQKQIHFSLEHKLDAEAMVWLDRAKMKKVLHNVLSNALKFTPSEGAVILSISKTADTLRLKVSDTGTGIHPDDLPHIFDRYYQSAHQSMAQEAGTGIGLGLVREIALLMGGRSYAESTLGEGSTFNLEIPYKPTIAELPEGIAEQQAGEEAVVPMVSGEDVTILLVEDNPDMQEFVRSILAPQFKEVLVAKNGREGLDQLSAHGDKIDLIISDIMMPELDGLSMMQQIKANQSWQSIPVIMLTALSAERDKLSALTIGVDDYLTKPFSVPELEARVQNLLYNYRQRQAWFKAAGEQSQAEGKILHPPMQAPTFTQADKEWIEGLESQIQDSFTKASLNVEAMAEQNHLSPRQFRRKIKAITGLAPGQFIKEVQLQAARSILEEGTVHSLGDVAMQCGFENQSTFSKVFKTRFGKSPRQYLRSVSFTRQDT